jgi:hypothetical protein
MRVVVLSADPLTGRDEPGLPDKRSVPAATKEWWLAVGTFCNGKPQLEASFPNGISKPGSQGAMVAFQVFVAFIVPFYTPRACDEISASVDRNAAPSVVTPAKAGTQAATGSPLSRG